MKARTAVQASVQAAVQMVLQTVVQMLLVQAAADKMEMESVTLHSKSVFLYFVTESRSRFSRICFYYILGSTPPTFLLFTFILLFLLSFFYLLVFSVADSIRGFVRPSVGWLVGRSVGPHFTFFICLFSY